ncbi:MAG: hypothetical protein AB7P16_28470 [Bradyrhizobium sp.]|uniref:hypothetical protein n=1 Tax=Bradyrhizobium sp. TaxID=376 RepID=UPI003D14BBB3
MNALDYLGELQLSLRTAAVFIRVDDADAGLLTALLVHRDDYTTRALRVHFFDRSVAPPSALQLMEQDALFELIDSVLDRWRVQLQLRV